MDNTESKKKINKLSIIKKRRKRKGTNQNSKTQGGVFKFNGMSLKKLQQKKSQFRITKENIKQCRKNNRAGQERGYCPGDSQPNLSNN
jgi:hypothetical protein